MTWGTHCPQCGREDCSWVGGDYCEGNQPPPPKGFRIRPALGDFGSPNIFFYVEEERPTWFGLFRRWTEVEGCRAASPPLALEKLKIIRSVHIRRP